MENLGKILKYIRVFNRERQLETAKKINICRSYLSKIEAGRKTPSIEVLQRYSDCYDVSLSAILLFTEQYENKGDLKNKAKAFVTKKTLGLLEWICKE